MLSLIALGDEGAGVRLAREHVRFAGLEQHVVEGEAEADIHIVPLSLFCCVESWPPM
jgi:hypothetical protein